MLFDSHTHLESKRYDSDRDQVITRAKRANVGRMVTCGSDLATSQQSIALAQTYEGVYAAVGVHPHEARTIARPHNGGIQVDSRALETLRAMATESRIVAIGEIGLDYHYDFSPRPVQRAVLAAQLELAAQLGLPVILHNRESDEDFRRVLEAAPTDIRGVLHCFLAEPAMADWALARGLYIGIAGPITWGKMPHLDVVVQSAPRERLLIETDCPYLAPHPVRGRRNEPAYVRYVAARVAQLWGATPDEVAQQTTNNANRLFGLA